MRHPELPVVSFLCIALVLTPLRSHIRAGSIAIIALAVWLAVLSLIRGVNSLIWANNFDVRVPIWCDIGTKITVGFSFAVPAAALSILRHLESVASARITLRTKQEKRRRQIFEGIMCFGVPMIFMAVHYTVQGHRFDLFEDFGCYPAVYFSIPSIILLYAPPLLMSFISFIYAALSLRHFLRHRINFTAHLRNVQSSLSASHYFRLMALALVEMFWDTGINIYVLWFNILVGVRPWTNWADVHSNFSRIGIYPKFLSPPPLLAQLAWQWWIVPISCFFFFIFFGFGEEAKSDYCAAFAWVQRVIFRQKPIGKAATSILPVAQRINSLDLPPYSAQSTSPSQIKCSFEEEKFFKRPESSLFTTITSTVTHSPFVNHSGNISESSPIDPPNVYSRFSADSTGSQLHGIPPTIEPSSSFAAFPLHHSFYAERPESWIAVYASTSTQQPEHTPSRLSTNTLLGGDADQSLDHTKNQIELDFIPIVPNLDLTHNH